MVRSFASGLAASATCNRVIALAAVVEAAVCLAVVLSLTFVRAAEGSLGVGAYSYDASSEAFVAEKFGLDDAVTGDQTLQSTGSSRSASSLSGVSAVEEVSEASASTEATAESETTAEVQQDSATSAASETKAVDESATEPVSEPVASEATVAEALADSQAEASAEEVPAAEEAPVSEESAVTWYTASASAYDPNSNGGVATASGIPLDWSTPTVASPWLPLGSYVEISYNGVVVVAQVTDRGPYVDGRDLDLSPGVFYAFGFDSADSWGVRTVSYRVL